MGRFDAWCGGMMLLCIAGGIALGGRGGGAGGHIFALGFVGIIAAWLLVRIMLIVFYLGRCVIRDAVHLATGGCALGTLPQHGAVQPQRLRGPQDFIERLCRQSGWLLVSREHDRYVVRSGDHTAQHEVHIRWNPSFANTVFQGWFPIRFSLEREAPGLYARLMLRNRDLHWSSWTMDLGGSCEACTYVAASLPTESLNARLFGSVCREIAGEAQRFSCRAAGQVAVRRGPGDGGYPLPGTGTAGSAGRPADAARRERAGHLVSELRR